jgi:hypothetical protein
LIIIFVFLILLVPIIILIIGRIFSYKSRIAGSGKLKTEERVVSKFNGISVSGPWNVKVNSGEVQKLVIKSDDNILRNIDTKVMDGILRISSKANLSPKAGSDIIISAGNINSITGAGAVRFIVNGVSTESFIVKLAEACKAEMSGEAVDLTVKGAGSTEIGAKDFLSERVIVKIAGAAEAVVFAAQKLDVEIAGAGTVKYYGNPMITKKMAGAAKLTRM